MRFSESKQRRYDDAQHLHPRRIEHNPDRSAHGFWREVRAECSANSASVSMCATHFTPDSSEASSLNGPLGLVHISDTLAQVKFSVLSAVHTIDLQKSNLF